jgi:hypothetical protein
MGLSEKSQQEQKHAAGKKEVGAENFLLFAE